MPRTAGTRNILPSVNFQVAASTLTHQSFLVRKNWPFRPLISLGFLVLFGAEISLLALFGTVAFDPPCSALLRPLPPAVSRTIFCLTVIFKCSLIALAPLRTVRGFFLPRPRPKRFLVYV